MVSGKITVLRKSVVECINYKKAVALKPKLDFSVSSFQMVGIVHYSEAHHSASAGSIPMLEHTIKKYFIQFPAVTTAVTNNVSRR